MKLTGRSKRSTGCYRGGWEGTAIRHVQKIAPRPGEVFRNGFFYTLVSLETLAFAIHRALQDDTEVLAKYLSAYATSKRE